MKIYINRLEKKQYPYFLRRLGTSHFLKLHGFNINASEDDIEIRDIDPVYIPLFKFIQEGGQIIFDFHLWKEQCISVVLMGVPPYIYIAKSSEIRLDYEEED
jgi:hypothetical protein